MFIPGDIKGKINFYSLPLNFYKIKKNPDSIIKMIKQYYKLYKLMRIENKVRLIICVDPMGLVIAGRIQRLIKSKIIYFSFEIFSEDEFLIEGKKILKTLEKKYSKNADMVVIQDSRREKLLKEVNNFGEKTEFMHVPVSPEPMKINSNDYNIYSALNIPDGKTIVVYSGTLRKWSGISEILNLFPDKWNQDFWLVIHSHHKLIEDEVIKNKIENLRNNNYSISYHNKPFSDYASYAGFLSKCHIGIATYFPDRTDIFAGKNIEEIGLSSGKFSTYMMIGIPTITTANSLYPELNCRYNFGETIKSIQEITGALIKIRNDYDKKIKGCKSLYENVLNPVSGINKLVNCIDNIIQN
jgi:hypothetical protein